ncbi:asparagine synthetase [Pseudomonas aeruginosa]|nr:asparagine synthetase [Pseudomonas aeruginosa]
MCGITGWTDWSRDLGEQRSILERMTRTLAPRGPDAEGLWLSRHALLGHRRLAIIDLENGAQPMLAEAGGRVALTYSGEVYNFRELRAELETLGQVFRTRSDTEVVLRAYLQRGEASFARLRGIYGFALWDEREQSLWLVRDRFGVKPLYYYPTAGGVLFASEPKAIFANPEANPVLDASGIAELFALTTAPTPGHGLYKGLRQVRPGQALRFDRNGVRELVYWALRAERHEEGAEDSAERAGQLLREAVAEQLVADVPLGSLLSGGLDSSAISAFAVAALDGDARRLPTFSVDFPGEGRGFVPTPWQSSWDEPYAQLAANFLGTPHRTVLVAPEEVLEQDERCSRPATCPAGRAGRLALPAVPPGPRAHHGGTVGRVGRRGVRRLPVLPRPERPRTRRLPLAGRQERALATAAAGGRRTGWRRRNTSGRATARPSPKCRDWMARMPPSGASARSPTWR